ncbi:MAG: hypothetical protein ABWY25_00825 [Paenisporosarcina sp.]
MTTNYRTYSELIMYDTFEERYTYLRLGGSVGHATFGFDRYINQSFYTSREWKDIRRHVILRDDGCDLAVPGYEIATEMLIHHINPMSADDINHGESWILDPEFLITTTTNTHNAIHFGDKSLLPKPFVPRRTGDTKLW